MFSRARPGDVAAPYTQVALLSSAYHIRCSAPDFFTTLRAVVMRRVKDYVARFVSGHQFTCVHVAIHRACIPLATIPWGQLRMFRIPLGNPPIGD